MTSLIGRKPIMALYSGTNCLYGHGCRIVLKEKEIDCEVIFTDPDDTCQELTELNPYNETPTLYDRDLVLYDSSIINEYLDERLPHPPLMPVDPITRAKQRLMLMRIDRDWFSVVEDLNDAKKADQARKVIRDGLISISPVFAEQPYLMGEEYSMVDVVLAPLLWRLSTYNIVLPKQAKSVEEYAERLFEREAFQSSLSEAERDLKI